VNIQLSMSSLLFTILHNVWVILSVHRSIVERTLWFHNVQFSLPPSAVTFSW